MLIDVFLIGGYFDGAMYGKIEQALLPDEILMHHYENPSAKMQGVTILGITQKGPDDITIVEKYIKAPETGTLAYYQFEKTVEPQKVVRVETLDGDYVLKMKEIEEEEGDAEYYKEHGFPG